jgi:hypothetical protein
MSEEVDKPYKCMCNDCFTTEEELWEHISMNIDATDFKMHGVKE